MRPATEQYDKRCVCQICTCGQHKCPAPKVKGDYTTSYKNTFTAPQLNSSLKPDPLSTPIMQRKAPPPVFNSVPFYGQSEYKKNFAAMNPQDGIQKRRIIQQAAKKNIFDPVKFEGSSSYKDSFKPYQMSPKSIPLYKQYQKISIPFQGQSTYKKQFIPQVNVKPQYPVSSNPLLNNSRYRSQSIQKPKHNVPFIGQSSYKDQFQGYQIPTPISSSPPLSKNVPKGYLQGVKFQGQSSYKDQFQDRSKNILKACPCVKLNVPYVNYSDNNHMHYNYEKLTFE